MSAEYTKVKGGKLKLKGVKKRPKDGDRKRKLKEEAGAVTSKASEDDRKHGGWWCIRDAEAMPLGCQVSFEWGDGTYLAAMDNGKFTMGPKHADSDGPSPEEQFGLIAAPDCDWVSFKTGYNKYMGVDSEGRLSATAEAVGAREKWELVYEEGRAAIQSMSNQCFVCFEGDKEGYVFASAKTAKANEIMNLRTSAAKVVFNDYTPETDKKLNKDMETEYVKMYQHSKVDLKNRLHTTDFGDRSTIRQGREEGNLHEILLDRRSKTKSDKYC